MSDLREKIADLLYPGGTQANYVDYLEKAEQIIDEAIPESKVYMQAYRAGWNDALAELLKQVPVGFTHDEFKRKVQENTKE